jgi:hypothetical protein
MWYISFHGGEDKGQVNNVLAYQDSGKPHDNPNVLPTGGSDPALRELRGFEIVDDLLYVVNAYKDYSQVLTYRVDTSGDYSFKEVFASMDATNSVLHPYDLTFDAQGNCYVSSQDTNVVTGLQRANDPLPVASYLRQQYPPPAQFLAGTIVASSIGALPNVPSPTPPDVAAPQGLDVSFTNDKNTEVGNSIRGVLFHDGFLYVANEVASAINVYDGKTGELHGQIAGSNLVSPVQLLVNQSLAEPTRMGGCRPRVPLAQISTRARSEPAGDHPRRRPPRCWRSRPCFRTQGRHLPVRHFDPWPSAQPECAPARDGLCAATAPLSFQRRRSGVVAGCERRATARGGGAAPGRVRARGPAARSAQPWTQRGRGLGPCPRRR